jgi:pimeloyl-ACP methyl ester carboxylesterase
MTNKVISLGEGITLSGDARLQADMRLVPPHLESLGAASVPPPQLFAADSGALESLGAPAAAGGAEMGVLEVSGINDPSLVTAHNPLLLTLEEGQAGDALVMPYTFDGEFYLPLGYSRTENGRTEIAIEQLPTPGGKPALESLGAVSILFQKIVSDVIGTAYEYPRLSAATVMADGRVIYEANSGEVRRRVAGAQRILLYIHGLFGSSEGYVASAVGAGVKDGPAPKLAEKYDLILAFDYESLNTAVEWTARELRWALEAVGLGANHGKTLHIVAHSLGGLVARWFIEMEGGREIAQHLVMAGTPHLGSPWSKIHDWAGTVLSLGLNSLSTVVWPLKIVGSLVKGMEAIDVTVDEMDPSSLFMQLLATNRDPAVPMTVLAGNTSIKPEALQKQPGESSALERLFERLEGMQLVQKAAGLAFFGKPNDMLVSVQSAFGVPQGHSLVSRVEIPCDHMSFFLLADALRKMEQALTGD